MTVHDEHDGNDLEALIRQIRDRPRDIVPKQPYSGSNADLADLIASGPVDVTWTDVTDTGVSVHHGRETFTRPVDPAGDTDD